MKRTHHLCVPISITLVSLWAYLMFYPTFSLAHLKGTLPLLLGGLVSLVIGLSPVLPGRPLSPGTKPNPLWLPPQKS